MDTIFVDIDGLNGDYTIIDNIARDFQSVIAVIRKGLEHMQNGLDTKGLAKYQKEIRTMEDKMTGLENLLGWASVILLQSIHNYQSLDQSLASHANDYIDGSSGNVSEPPNRDESWTPYENPKVPKDFNERVEALKNTEKFRKGDPWGDLCTFDNSCWGCVAMAREMQKRTIGVGTRGIRFDSISDIQVGDVIQFSGVGARERTAKHHVFVIGKTENGLLIGEGNVEIDGVRSVDYCILDYSSIGRLMAIERVV